MPLAGQGAPRRSRSGVDSFFAPSGDARGMAPRLKRALHRFRHSVWRRRLAESAAVWALFAVAAGALYLGLMGPIVDVR
jgi:hypothetical protein